MIQIFNVMHVLVFSWNLSSFLSIGEETLITLATTKYRFSRSALDPVRFRTKESVLVSRVDGTYM